MYIIMVEKKYIKVCAVFTKDGNIIPKSFLYDDGNKYKIDRILDVRRKASKKTGGSGICYTVIIEGKEKELFIDDNKWYMEVNS